MAGGFSKSIYKIEKKSKPTGFSETIDQERIEKVSEEATVVKELVVDEEVDAQEQVELEWESDVEKGVSFSKFKKFYLIAGAVTLLFVGCLCWGVWGLFFATPENTEEGTVQRDNYVDLRAQRERVVEGYLTSETWQERANYVRHAEQVIPLMERYYNKHIYEPIDLTGARKYEVSIAWKKRLLWHVRYVRDGEVIANLIVEEDSEGKPSVDWESEVIYQPVAMSDFRESRSRRKHLFRVFIEGAHLNGFHGYEFADFRKYRCFKVTLPRTDEYLWAYTEIGTPLDDKLMGVVTGGGKHRAGNGKFYPVLLKLAFPQYAQSDRCVHIKELIPGGWVLPRED